MLSVSCTALKLYREEIIRDIQGDVIKALFDKQVLTKNEYEQITSLVSVGNKTCILTTPLNGFDFLFVNWVFNIFKMIKCKNNFK